MSRLDKATNARRQELYDSGKSDIQISRELGIHRISVRTWRVRRGLPSNSALGLCLTKEQNAARMLLYNMRYSDGRIAREQRVSEHSIQKWRLRRHLPAHGIGYRADRWQRRNDTTLDRIKRAIGRKLPPDIADDAVSNLYLAVLDGSVRLEAIEKEARRFGNRVLGDYASRFGPRSLDEDLSDGEGFRLIDMIRDDSSSAWLEAAGATVW